MVIVELINFLYQASKVVSLKEALVESAQAFQGTKEMDIASQFGISTKA